MLEVVSTIGKSVVTDDKVDSIELMTSVAAGFSRLDEVNKPSTAVDRDV
jgi:hypothetical protein